MCDLQNVGADEKKPLVSFVVPCYNIPVDMLRECIDSILAVALNDDERELLLIDDGSSLDYSSLLKDYEGKLIYVRQKNGGLSAARNTGIERAKGTYIQFVDGDDCLLKQGYDACLSLIIEKKSDLLLFSFMKERTDGTKFNVPSPTFNVQRGSSYMLHNNLCASACSYLFHRSVLDGLRFEKGLLHEDELFTPLLFLQASSVIKTDYTAYYYRQREQSIVHTVDNSHLQKRLDDTEHILSVLHNVVQTLNGEAQKALQRRVSQLSMDYIYNTISLASYLTEIETRISRLKQLSLYPLPYRHYTFKYWLFSLVANHKIGLRLLFHFLKIQDKQ